MTRKDKGVPRNRESRILPAFVSRVRMNLRISLLADWVALEFLLGLAAPTRRGFLGVTSNCLLVSNDGCCFTVARLSLRLGLIVPPQADAERPSTRAKCTTRAIALSTEPYISISPCLKGRVSTALLVATTLAEERATGLAEARTAVEADLKTREGTPRKAGKS